MYNHLEYKILVLGDPGVSKTTFIVRSTSGHFVEEYEQLMEDSYRRQISVDHEIAVTELLECDSQNDYAILQDQLILECEGFFVFYSITSRESFERVYLYVEKEIHRVKQDNRYPVILIGSKADINSERKISVNEGETCARLLDAAFFEVSAKTGQNVDECIHEMVRLIRKSRSELNPDTKRAQRQCVLF